jgi:hypothetical protein
VALRLKRNGITRIRPLQGGLTLWMTREFPVEELTGRLTPAGLAKGRPADIERRS